MPSGALPLTLVAAVAAIAYWVVVRFPTLAPRTAVGVTGWLTAAVGLTFAARPTFALLGPLAGQVAALVIVEVVERRLHDARGRMDDPLDHSRRRDLPLTPEARRVSRSRAPRAAGAAVAQRVAAGRRVLRLRRAARAARPAACSASDGWLALVGGRLIAHHGVPQHDTLAALTSGRQWVDQQWLGQLATYWLDSVGGIRLLLAVNVVLVAGAFVAAGVYARRRGAEPATLALVLLAARTAVPRHCDERAHAELRLPAVRPARRVDVTRPAGERERCGVRARIGHRLGERPWLGAARGRPGRAAGRGRPASRPGGAVRRGCSCSRPWLCLLASPYHVHLVSYYHRTAFNSSFATYLSQWAPTTFSPISAPLLVLVFATVWMLGKVGHLVHRVRALSPRGGRRARTCRSPKLGLRLAAAPHACAAGLRPSVCASGHLARRRPSAR